MRNRDTDNVKHTSAVVAAFGTVPQKYRIRVHLSGEMLVYDPKVRHYMAQHSLSFADQIRIYKSVFP